MGRKNTNARHTSRGSYMANMNPDAEPKPASTDELEWKTVGHTHSTGTTSWPMTPTTTTTGTTWVTGTFGPGITGGGSVSVGSKKTPKKVEPVVMPPKLGKKMIIAFLDDSDEAYWGKKLEAENVEIYMDEDGQSHMTLRLSMMDVYENDS